LGSYAPVTENENGVYLFAAVPQGAHTIRVSASGYASSQKVATIDSSDQFVYVFPMNTGSDSGEGEGEGDNGGPGCAAQSLTRGSAVGDWALVFVLVLTLLLLGACWRPVRR